MFKRKVDSDPKKIEDLLARGVDEVIDRAQLQERLLRGDQLRVKLGIDPTSPNIHLGRAVLLRKLKKFQDLGHKAVFIVGDFTGQIGDTSDKESERPMLSEEEIKKNTRTYFEQAFKILDRQNTETHYNSRWLKKLGFIEIGKMADKFGLHEVITRELIKKRLDAGKRVSLREVLYPLMQGYDSVAVKADVELGGTDQRFNLLAGRQIQPFYNQASQNVVIMKFPLPGTDGRKMSSSWGNVINIIDKPIDMFGKLMSINDDLVQRYFEMATDIPDEQIKHILNKVAEGGNPMEAKIYLAEEIVGIYHGSETAKKAKEEFKRIFSQKEKPTDIEAVENKGTILETSVSAGIVSSNSEMKRLVDQKAVRLNDQLVEKWDQPIKTGDIVQIGPRKFYKVK